MKELFKSRHFKGGLNAVLLSIAVIGIIILLNLLLSKYSYKIDTTQEKVFKLSEQTINVLSGLDKSGKTLNVYLFTTENEFLDLKTKNMIFGLIKQYEKTSNKFLLKTLDIERNPQIARNYGVTDPYDVVFEIDQRTKTVSLPDMFEGEAFNAEQAFTSAINNILNENPSVVYFIQGHKEASLDTMTILKRNIEKEGYIIKTVNLALEGNVPTDASMLIDIGAKEEFAQKEINILKAYFEQGGRAIFLMRTLPESPQIKSVKELLKPYNVNVNDDIAIDPSRNFVGMQNLVIPEYQQNQIVSKLKEISQYYMVIPDSRSISIIDEGNAVKVEPLLESSSNAWGETNIGQYKSEKPKLNTNDNKGPVIYGAYITKELEDSSLFKMVVLGSDLFVLDGVLQSTRSMANIDFMLNSMVALNDKEQTISIRPKPLNIKTLVLKHNQQAVLYYTLIFLLPLTVIVAGIIIWFKRRHL